MCLTAWPFGWNRVSSFLGLENIGIRVRTKQVTRLFLTVSVTENVSSPQFCSVICQLKINPWSRTGLTFISILNTWSFGCLCIYFKSIQSTLFTFHNLYCMDRKKQTSYVLSVLAYILCCRSYDCHAYALCYILCRRSYVIPEVLLAIHYCRS